MFKTNLKKKKENRVEQIKKQKRKLDEQTKLKTYTKMLWKNLVYI
jgi:hypothetical protein